MSSFDIFWAGLPSGVRLGAGSGPRHGGARRTPSTLLELYEFEACPFCRKVREAMTELDLEYICRPCAHGSRHRAEVPPGTTFPYLVDRDADVAMAESEDILDHLHERYGGGRSELARRLAPLSTVSSAIASAVRPHGRRVTHAAREPEQLLVLYQFESCPYCRRVREVLNELDLPHHVKSCARGSVRRDELRALGGKTQVPYLVDPAQGVAMYESNEIIRYLRRTYG